jgi:hypothetical protein
MIIRASFSQSQSYYLTYDGDPLLLGELANND